MSAAPAASVVVAPLVPESMPVPQDIEPPVSPATDLAETGLRGGWSHMSGHELPDSFQHLAGGVATLVVPAPDGVYGIGFFNESNTPLQCLCVRGVVPNRPAAMAGAEKYDVVLSLNGASTKGMAFRDAHEAVKANKGSLTMRLLRPDLPSRDYIVPGCTAPPLPAAVGPTATVTGDAAGAERGSLDGSLDIKSPGPPPPLPASSPPTLPVATSPPKLAVSPVLTARKPAPVMTAAATTEPVPAQAEVDPFVPLEQSLEFHSPPDSPVMGASFMAGVPRALSHLTGTVLSIDVVPGGDGRFGFKMANEQNTPSRCL